MKIYNNLFETIISFENLFSAWDAFKSGKRSKPDVQLFEWNLEQNIFQLHRDLKNRTYKHGPYTGFYIRDPKQRHIHKAAVRDRILHHAIFSVINPIFEETFIPTSFSCRIGFGTHRGVDALERMARAVAKNETSPCFILKCDVRKFFDAVDHQILVSILRKRIKDNDTMWLLESIIESYATVPDRERERERVSASLRKGIPIGNLTSQLFANVYMNEFDQFMKHTLKVKYYLRYTNDFVIINRNPEYLQNLLPSMNQFLGEKLVLQLHPPKISLRKVYQGIDFLGYFVFPRHRLIRTKTRRRIFTKLRRQIRGYSSGKITQLTVEQSLQSYLGILSHANTYRLSQQLKNQYWFWLNR